MKALIYCFDDAHIQIRHLGVTLAQQRVHCDRDHLRFGARISR